MQTAAAISSWLQNSSRFLVFCVSLLHVFSCSVRRNDERAHFRLSSPSPIVHQIIIQIIRVKTEHNTHWPNNNSHKYLPVSVFLHQNTIDSTQLGRERTTVGEATANKYDMCVEFNNISRVSGNSTELCIHIGRFDCMQSIQQMQRIFSSSLTLSLSLSHTHTISLVLMNKTFCPSLGRRGRSHTVGFVIIIAVLILFSGRPFLINSSYSVCMKICLAQICARGGRSNVNYSYVPINFQLNYFLHFDSLLKSFLSTMARHLYAQSISIASGNGYCRSTFAFAVTGSLSFCYTPSK